MKSYIGQEMLNIFPDMRFSPAPNGKCSSKETRYVHADKATSSGVGQPL